MRPKQQTLAASGFERYRKRTRREQFLADMNQVVPWDPLVDLIAPVHPKRAKAQAAGQAEAAAATTET